MEGNSILSNKILTQQFNKISENIRYKFLLTFTLQQGSSTSEGITKKLILLKQGALLLLICFPEVI